MHHITKSPISIIIVLMLAVLITPAVSWGLPHLWLSTDPNFLSYTDGEGGDSYIYDSTDDWLTDSYVTDESNFSLFIYNKNKDITATNIQLIMAIHEGESGLVNVNGTDYTSFTGTGVPEGYGGDSADPSHGVYEPSGDGRYAIANLNLDLAPQQLETLAISWGGFTEVHFDAYSENDLWNPASHDATAVPEPGTIMLLGSGLVGIAAFGRKKFRK